MEKFVVIGNIVGKSRPRFTRIGGYVRTYTPKKTHDYESLIKESYTGKKYEGALKIGINAYFKIPVSYTKKKKIELPGKVYMMKPDIDNIAKSVLDGLNGTAWSDDTQVVEMNITKHYATDDVEKLVITIEGLDEENNERNVKNL